MKSRPLYCHSKEVGKIWFIQRYNLNIRRVKVIKLRRQVAMEAYKSLGREQIYILDSSALEKMGKRKNSGT